MPTIEKTIGEAFAIDVGVGNGGDLVGTWNIYLTLTGDWSWTSASQTVTLNPGQATTLTFEGTIPTNLVHCKKANITVVADPGGSIPTDYWLHVYEGTPPPTPPTPPSEVSIPFIPLAVGAITLISSLK